MKINGEELKTLEVYHKMITMPDCCVVPTNKIGDGNGEAKLYLGPDEKNYAFFGGYGFSAKCFMLKKDLLAYMTAIKNEYFKPSQIYRCDRNHPKWRPSYKPLNEYWNTRYKMIESLKDVIFFRIDDQNQIKGNRGYVNASDPNYKIVREIALPLVSYLYIEKVGKESDPLYYLKLFVDFDAIWETANGPLVFNYGKKKNKTASEIKEVKEGVNAESKSEKKQEEIKKAREGQGKYREQLLTQCRYCPFTMIADERLLIASHIKPWAASDDDEKIDPYNGYMLSPLYDKLFDRGFITFTEDRHLILSEFISPYTWNLIKLKNNTFIKALPMDDKRIKYLKFHHESVFKGAYGT